MDWIQLTNEAQLQEIKQMSYNTPVVLFKHSTTCSISAMAKSRLDRATAIENVPFYYIDLLRFRPLSNAIAELFGVRHESPQILLIKNGECIYDDSHNGINMEDIGEEVKACLMASKQ